MGNNHDIFSYQKEPQTLAWASEDWTPEVVSEEILEQLRSQHEIKVGDIGSSGIEVVDDETGETVSLVQKLCLSEGWLIRYTEESPGKLKLTHGRNLEFERVEGKFSIRALSPPPASPEEPDSAT